MKCPKCQYIGFETGDRCKNCGYEFALMRADEAEDVSDSQSAREIVEPFDLLLRPAERPGPEMTPALPLFRAEDADDEPLVRVTAPRPPVAVRKTPEPYRNPSRGRATPPDESPMRDAVLEFGSEPALDFAPVRELLRPPRQQPAPDPGDAVAATLPAEDAAVFTPLTPRLVAALIDHGLLLAIDAIVIYFTLRLTALTLADWRVVPAVPLLAFLVGLKLAYLATFTLAGGQTIGKMAAGIKVVGDGDQALDRWQVVQRAVIAMASLAALGAPFLMALADPARRGLHDRVAHTRVVPVS